MEYEIEKKQMKRIDRNYWKKKNYLSIIFILVSVFCFGQEIPKIENLPKEKKISYSFITEHGIYMWWAGYTGIFVNGICLNKTQDLVGIGIGLEYDIASGPSYPIFVNYRHYFPSKAKLEPLINIAIGTRLCAVYSWKPSMLIFSKRLNKVVKFVHRFCYLFTSKNFAVKK